MFMFVRLGLLFLSVFVSEEAFSETKAESKMFIKQFNHTLDTFGRDSGIKIRYDDAKLVDDPIAGKYISLEQPSIIYISEGIQYEVSTRNIALRNADTPVITVSLPRTIRLSVSPVGSTAAPEEYSILLYGIPTLELQTDSTNHVKHYRLTYNVIQSAISDTIEFRVAKEHIINGNKKTDTRHTLRVNRPTQNSKWHLIQPLQSADIGALLKKIYRTANQ